MKQTFRLILLAGLVVLGIWLWTVFFPTPKKVIYNRLVKVARLASFNSAQGKLTGVANIQRLGTFFTDDVEVVVNVPGYETRTFNRRAELTQAAMAARTVTTGLKVDFPDINVQVNPDGKSAIANVAMQARVAGQSDLIVQNLTFTLQKIDGAWLITRIETARMLQ